MAEKQSNKRNPEQVRIAALLVGGAFLILLVQKLTAPGVPPSDGMNDYTFQPEPRPAKGEDRKPAINLGVSSGALPSIPASAPAPRAQSASCSSLQQFANYEYGRRYSDGKLTDLLSFSGFEATQPSLNEEGVITCSGGEYVRMGPKSERSCKNVIITYDTRTNTLSHNVQYRYLESGLVAQCAEGRVSGSR